MAGNKINPGNVAAKKSIAIRYKLAEMATSTYAGESATYRA